VKSYSIIRVGNEYIVQANHQSVLRISSRRMAARLITDASRLLEQPGVVRGEASIARDRRKLP
jgi:hypothetical protein